MSATDPRGPGDEDQLAEYDALPDTQADDETIDISRNEGPELTVNVDDIDTGAAVEPDDRR